MTRDLYDKIYIQNGLLAANHLTSGSPFNGPAVQVGFVVGDVSAPAPLTVPESCAIFIDVGLPGDTLSGSVTIEFDLQEGYWNGASITWSAAADTSILNPVGVANGAANTGAIALLTGNAQASKVIGTGYTGMAQFLRVVALHVGSQTVGTPYSALFVLGNLSYRPPSGNAT